MLDVRPTDTPYKALPTINVGNVKTTVIPTPIMPRRVEIIRAFLRPCLIASPLKIDPKAIPKTSAESKKP